VSNDSGLTQAVPNTTAISRRETEIVRIELFSERATDVAIACLAEMAGAD
jgi:hypothetical protein